MEAKVLISEEAEEPPSTAAATLSRPVSLTPNPLVFRQTRFPNASDRDRNDWHWQLRNRITSFSGLARMIQLSDSERNCHPGDGPRTGPHRQRYISLGSWGYGFRGCKTIPCGLPNF